MVIAVPDATQAPTQSQHPIGENMWCCSHCRRPLNHGPNPCACGDRSEPEFVEGGFAVANPYANPYATPVGTEPVYQATLVDDEETYAQAMAAKRRADDEKIQFSRQISLREIMGLMTFLSLIFAFLAAFGKLGAEIFALIVITNVVGIIMGLLVTRFGGLPTDG